LPPHDLLDRVVAEGELRERIAATVPAPQRLAALDMVDAFLAQALQLDGARYATPYGLVRALKRRRIEVAPPSHPEAVQLLTVHGAKGLEAQVVFVMDADPERRNEDTATLLVDWPVDSMHPRRCAFVYSEARAPASLRELLAHEQAARRREELNGLYVAMTRARRHLVFSATQPFNRSSSAAPSWWERLAPVVAPWAPAPTDMSVTPTGASFAMPVLPVLPPRPPSESAPAASPDTPASRLGQAVHRVLEWAAVGGQTAALERLAEAASAEFGAPASEVLGVARTILASPQCRRFFAGDGLRWAGNEVPITWEGEALRIDRMVEIEEAGTLTWWVLDYKLNAQPHELLANRAQLLRYREAVRRAEPGAAVRCAFISGRGDLIEID
jgi:ATP-dependent helicase/nuclease subunit A